MEKHISLQDILNYEQRYRTTFINSLGGFKSTALIGSRGGDGYTNLAIFNSFFHVGANPPYFGFVVRPDSVDRHTLSNIMDCKEFTVNHVAESFYTKAHQTSARYEKEISEFDAVGLTEEFVNGNYVPYVKESRVKIYATFSQRIDVSVNNTIIIIAKIKEVVLPQDCIGEDGYVDLNKAGSVTTAGLDSYFVSKPLERLPYAKPQQFQKVA